VQTRGRKHAPSGEGRPVNKSACISLLLRFPKHFKVEANLKVLIISTVFAAVAAAQSASIEGRITDPSGSAVQHATVAVTARDANLRRTTFSDNSGVYRFEAVMPGEYLLESKATGFSASPVIRVTAGAGSRATADVQLELARLSSQVQVTASGTAQSTNEESKVVDIIDSRQLQDRAEFSFAEALRLVPGLRIQQLGGPGSLTRIQTRGMRAYDTALLIDGFRLRDAAAPQGDASAFMGDLILTNTDRIEVERGSGSSLYGTNAAAGVINIVTDQGGGPFHGGFDLEGGGLGLFRSAARGAGGAWNDRLRYTLGISHLNVTRGIDGNDRYRNSSAQGSAQLTLGATAMLTTRIYASDAYADLNDTAYSVPASKLPNTEFIPAIANVTFIPAPDNPDSRRASRFFSGLVGFTQQLTPGVSYRVNYQGLSTRRDNRDGPAGTRFPPLFNDSNLFDGRLDTVQARTDLQIGSYNLVTAGYEWERENFDNLSTDENPDVLQRVNARLEIVQKSHALFLQDQIRLFSNRLQFSLSGRTQSFDLSSPVFTGGDRLYAGVKVAAPSRAWTGDGSVAYFFPTSGTKLRAHVGNGYRAPSLYERFGASFFFGSFSAYGDPTLRPERLLAFDTGIDQYLAGNRLRIRSTFFYTRIQEDILFDSSGITPGTDPYGRWGGYRNTGGGLARGVELSVEATPTRSLSVNSSYTYTNADERRSSLIGGSLRSIRIFPHMFTSTITQRFGHRVDVTFDFLAASDYLYPFSSRPFIFPGPRKGDIAAAYTHPISERHSLRFFTRVENVFNREYYEDGFRTPKAWATAGVKWLF
jgi:vitamin B12 transporter